MNDSAQVIAVIDFGEGQPLFTRSQAKRLMARVNSLAAVLDFKHVGGIGPSYADEIFRVFAMTNPNVDITYINANKSVVATIVHAKLAEFK